MATIASLIVEITSKQSGFEKGLDSATRSVSSFVGNATKKIARIGAITAAAMTGAAFLINRSFSEAANNIDMLSKAAERLGTPLGALQKLDFAASLADIDTDSLVRSMQLMGKNIFEAATQGGEAAKVFARLGLNLQGLQRLSADEQFRKIAESLQKVTSAGERSSLQMQIFGRTGIELTNLLNGSLKETDKQFKALGLGITTAQGKQVEAFNDTKTVLGKIFDGFKEQVAANVSPAFTAINNSIIKSVEEMGGIGTASDAFSIKIFDAAIAGVNAFGWLSNAITKIGLNFDDSMTKLDILLAGFSRVGEAMKGLSFANKTPTFKSNDFIDFTGLNKLIDFGKNIGEFSFKVANPDVTQLDKEFNMINPGMEKLKINQDKAAISMEKTTKSTEELTIAVLKAKAEFQKGIFKGPDKAKPGDPLFGGIGGAAGTSATGTGGALSDLFEGKRIPFSTDPAMDAILLKQAQDRAIIDKQFEDAKALRTQFPSVPFGTTGKGLSTSNTPENTIKIVMDTEGFFKFAQAPRFSNFIADTVTVALTDTATMGV